MRLMRIALILLAVILIFFGWTAYKEKGQKERINEIINKQQYVNEIEVKDLNKGKIIWTTKSEANQFKEQYPLSHIENLKKEERNQFAEKPDYTIIYKTKGKELYKVEILHLLDNNKVSKEMNSFIFHANDEEYIIYWEEQQKVFEQSSNTQKLLERIQKK